LGFTSFKDATVISESNICIRISLQHNLQGTESCFRENVVVLKFLNKSIYKGKAVPLQAGSGPEASRKLRFPDFMTTAQGGGKVVSHTYRTHLPPGNSPGTHFC